MSHKTRATDSRMAPMVLFLLVLAALYLIGPGSRHLAPLIPAPSPDRPDRPLICPKPKRRRPQPPRCPSCHDFHLIPTPECPRGAELP
jgi:hypothetical protein